MKEEISHYHETIGEALQVFWPFHNLYFAYAHVEYLVFVIFQGTELEFSGLAIEFRVDTAKTTYCQVFNLY